MAHIDNTIKKTVTAQFAGGTLMMISAYAPLSVPRKIAVATAGLALSVAGTVIGERRLEELKFQREVNEAMNQYGQRRLFHQTTMEDMKAAFGIF